MLDVGLGRSLSVAARLVGMRFSGGTLFHCLLLI
jgi:hypothetical protein